MRRRRIWRAMVGVLWGLRFAGDLEKLKMEGKLRDRRAW